MQRIGNYGFADVLPSADIDEIQDQALGIGQLPGIMMPPPYVYCEDGANIKIGPIRGLMLGNLNYKLFTSSESTFTPSSLSASTWYYLYGYDNSASLAFEKDTVVPDGSRTVKSLDATRRYIASFVTDSTGAILPFHAARGDYQYLRSVPTSGTSPFQVLSAGSATSFTDESLAPWVPPHARLAVVEAWFNTVGNACHAEFRGKGDSGTGANVYQTEPLPSSSVDTRIRLFRIRTDASQIIQYQATHADGRVKLFVDGFVE